MTTPNQPIPSWEEQFDATYGENLDTQLLGIIASALTHAQTKPFGTSASYLTTKLQKIVATAHTEWREEVLKAFDVECSEEHSQQHVEPSECGIVVDCIIARLPFLQPPKDTV